MGLCSFDARDVYIYSLRIRKDSYTDRFLFSVSKIPIYEAPHDKYFMFEESSGGKEIDLMEAGRRN